MNIPLSGHGVDRSALGAVEAAVRRALAPLVSDTLEAVRVALGALARERAISDAGDGSDGRS
jgi:hypothetical protein